MQINIAPFERHHLAAAKSGFGTQAPVSRMIAAVGVERIEHTAIGRQIGAYRIDAFLGRGGMGEVFRARDTRLGRDVAVKLLAPQFVSDVTRVGRFRLEAHLLASLNHPNIATVFSFEDFDKSSALVMELVDGPTLAERLTDGPLPIEEALRMAGQIAEALSAAHRNGILHRDIKPANIKITGEGRVKVLDFGLGKPTVAWKPDQAMETMPAATQAGIIVGTPAYMSPEQIRAEVVDARSDVWAFGCVLFELLTGAPPFRGGSIVEIAAAVLHTNPDWTQVPATTPSLVVSLLQSCLEKDRQKRWSEMVAAREQIDRAIQGQCLAALEPTAVTSIAVLPFANVSGDPEMEYLSDGITESIIASLARERGLRVMSRTTAFRYKGRAHDAEAVGRELHVTAVLTGSVLERGDLLIIKAELVDVQQGWQLWAGRYRRSRGEIFDTEDEIAREILSKLLPKLIPETAAVRRHTENAEAYQLYLRGRFYWEKRTEQGLKKAIQYFRQAIEADPTYALAHAGLAEGYVPLAVYCHLAPADAYPKARAAAEMALQIDSKLAQAHAVLGSYTANFEWNLSGAETQVRAALAANPKYSRAWQILADLQLITDRVADSEESIRRAVELDPLSLSLNAALAMNHFFSRRYDAAIEYGHRTVEMDANFFPGYLYLGLGCQLSGQHGQAITALQHGQQLAGDSTLMAAALAAAYAAAGNRDEALTRVGRLESIAGQKYVSQVFVAAVHLLLDDEERAIACLERGFDDRCYWFLRAVLIDPRFDAVRQHPRVRNLRRRMGLRA